jgi:dTDP-4-amino-4,6-dideoxygalactose transaminase
MATGVYKITDEFEKALSDYTEAPYVVTVDNQSNALFLALMYEKVKGKVIKIPARTYPSVRLLKELISFLQLRYGILH